MTKYITVLKASSITLDLMGRKKEFLNAQEVDEDIYTKAYPQYFKKIGETKGYDSYLAAPKFIPIEQDPIKDFVKKEEIRKTEKKVLTQDSEIQQVSIEDIAEDIEEKLEEKYNIDIDPEDLEDIIQESISENILEQDAKIETEE